MKLIPTHKIAACLDGWFEYKYKNKYRKVYQKGGVR